MKTKGCGVTKIVNSRDLESMAAAGMTPAEIGRYYNLTRQGMVAVIEKNPELQDAFHNGLHHVLVKCVNVLMDKLDKGELLAAIYMLNNRFGWKEAKYEKEKPDMNIPKINIYLPENGRDTQVIDIE